MGQVIFYGRQKARCTIVGVVGDTNYDGLQTPMPPMVHFYYPKGLGPISVASSRAGRKKRWRP